MPEPITATAVNDSRQAPEDQRWDDGPLKNSDEKYAALIETYCEKISLLLHEAAIEAGVLDDVRQPCPGLEPSAPAESGPMQGDESVKITGGQPNDYPGH